MFCPKCGTKLEEDAKFCKKCSQATLEVKKDDKPAPVVAEQKKPAGCSRGCGCIGLVFLLITYLSIVGYLHNQINGSWELRVAFYFFGAFFVVIFGWLIFRPRKKPAIQTPDQTSHTNTSLEKFRQSRLANVLSVIITIGAISAVAFIIFHNFKNFHINTTDDNGGTVIPSSSSAKSWDGYYTTTMTKPNCDSPIELDAFSVTDGAVMNMYGSNAKIGPAGKATMNMGSMTANFTFSSGGVSGTWSSSRCSGTFSGTKRW
ncbi:MAG TPA: zinc-ribbon domain-containing protein [Candidatus Saccharimonadales bacterium]|nr:zinc-ribbon domain-containing protein [Candidatus Saccharimonadales bacterium]